jgi:predicted phage tail component-like protein
MSGMTLNGIKKDYLKVLRGRKRPPWAPVKRNILTFPGMAGGYQESTDILPRPVDVPILIKAGNLADLQKLKEDLASWLITDQPVELIFDDEPDRVYYAVVDGSLDLEEIVNFGRGVITFICPDPFKYGAEDAESSTTDAVTIENAGSAETYPVVTCQINKDTTFVAIGNGEKINMIGEPASVDDVVFEPKTVTLNDVMASTVGWGAAGFNPEGSTKAGTIVSDGQVLKPSAYGTGSAWHGPALQKSISEQLQDFQVEFFFDFKATLLTEIGKIQLYGLDGTNKKLFMLGMADYWSNKEKSIPEGFLYNAAEAKKEIITSKSNDKYENFSGYLRIIRTGQNIEFLVKVTGNAAMTKRINYFDSKNEYQQKLSAIGIHFAAFGTTAPIAANNSTQVKVTKINQNTGVPYIARVGDEVVFDHKLNLITLNGDDITKEKAFIGEYFPLVPGVNSILVEPVDSISELEVRWRPAWR